MEKIRKNWLSILSLGISIVALLVNVSTCSYQKAQVEQAEEQLKVSIKPFWRSTDTRLVKARNGQLCVLTFWTIDAYNLSNTDSSIIDLNVSIDFGEGPIELERADEHLYDSKLEVLSQGVLLIPARQNVSFAVSAYVPIGEVAQAILKEELIGRSAVSLARLKQLTSRQGVNIFGAPLEKYGDSYGYNLSDPKVNPMIIAQVKSIENNWYQGYGEWYVRQ